MKYVTDPNYISKVQFGKSKYGRLTLIKLVGYFLEGKNRDKRRAAFKFQCECGNTIVTRAKDVKKGKIKSCGCLHKETSALTGKNNKLDDPCQAIRNNIWNRFKYNAKRRGIEVKINKSTVELYLNKNCHYCGSPPSNKYISKNNVCKEFRYNGIDRIDSNKGYEIKNIVPCCKHCN